jgi:serine/tyrosine/threonine adenylyltransferase
VNERLTPPHFFSRTVDELPADPETGPGTRQVLGACYSLVEPTRTTAPRLVAYSAEVAELLGFSSEEMQSEPFARVLSGNELLPGMQPHAACYGGHQFGSWAGQLGDGRALSLGEVRGPGGSWELQLKGAGPTPYSRRADGRAVLRSSLREFLCSEAMFHLGVPTTRALSLCLTGDQVVRDMFYDGRPELEPGAVVCRVAPTFLRFGNFEILASREDKKTLRRLLAFAIRHFFPELLPAQPAEDFVTSDVIARMFERVAISTAKMVVDWMRVGFVHGVMNTDNMSLLGLTIDYGPYGFLDDFDPTWTPNTTDAQGRRYRFGNQPRVCEWNLVQFANALLTISEDTASLEAGMAVFQRELAERQEAMMLGKLGLFRPDREQTDREQTERSAPEGRTLASELLDLLVETPTDMTIFFRNLADVPLEASIDVDTLRQPLEEAFYEPAGRSGDYLRALDAWLRRYVQAALDLRDRGYDPELRRRDMRLVNPRYVFRNYLAQQAIDLATKGDESEIHVLLDLLRRPYDDQPALASYAAKRPDWAKNRAGCSMLSCSS